MARPTDQNIKSQPRNAKGHLLPKVIDSPMKPIVDALNETLKAIRNRHPEIPNVVLVVGTSSTKKHGHFAPESWESKPATHEIMLSGESLARGPEATLGTLLHEAAHALAQARGIKDTSRQGRFHNTKFKALAEELGIEVAQAGNIGWSKTDVPKATLIEYKAELATLRKALKAWRKPTMAKVKAPSKNVRVSCDCRAVTVPIKFFAEGGMECLICGSQFEVKL